MQNFHQWLETHHPEVNEGFLKNAALAGAMALGSVAPNVAQAQPEQPTVTSQERMQQLRDRQEQRRNRFKLPIMMTLAGAAAAARAAKRKQ